MALDIANFFTAKQPVNTPNSTGTGANDENQDENKQSQSSSDTTQTNTPAPENNIDPLAELWQNQDAGPGAQSSSSAPPAVDRQPNQDQQQNDTVTNYINSLNFLPEGGVNTQQLSQELQEGNMAGLTNLVHDVAKRSFIQAITTVDKLVQPRIEEAINAAVLQSRESTHTDLGHLAMFKELAFTQEPAIKPVAVEVFNRATKAGKTVPEAINLVKTFFSKSAEGMGYVNPAEMQGPGNGPMRPGPRQGGNKRPQQEETDWIKTLTGEV